MKQRTTSKLTRSISLSKVQILLHINDVVHLTKRKPYSNDFQLSSHSDNKIPFKTDSELI